MTLVFFMEFPRCCSRLSCYTNQNVVNTYLLGESICFSHQNSSRILSKVLSYPFPTRIIDAICFLRQEFLTHSNEMTNRILLMCIVSRILGETYSPETFSDPHCIFRAVRTGGAGRIVPPYFGRSRSKAFSIVQKTLH